MPNSIVRVMRHRLICNDGAVSPGWSFPALRVFDVRRIGTELWVNLNDQEDRDK